MSAWGAPVTNKKFSQGPKKGWYIPWVVPEDRGINLGVKSNPGAGSRVPVVVMVSLDKLILWLLHNGRWQTMTDSVSYNGMDQLLALD